MALAMSFVSVAISILYTPFLLLILCIIFLASIGKSLGVRRLYVNILLKLFEYGRQHIEVAKKLQRNDSDDDDDPPPTTPDKPPSAVIKERGVNGVAKNAVIQREEILGPSPSLNYKRSASQERMRLNPSKLDDKTEYSLDFHVSHNLDLVKAGVEAIIEDQVTSVFEAEELRSWNLLTRTNRQYEFLTWRLTIIWMMGFLVRYFFLLPLRLLIFTIGVLTLVVSGVVISFLPPGKFARYLGSISYVVSFRIMIYGTFCHVRYHDTQYKPKYVCVANHTTPMDVAILSSNGVFSLVLTLISTGVVVSLLPAGKLRRSLGSLTYKMSFRILLRSISCVVTSHCTEHRPRQICVANHTSPIDVAVLSANDCYSLVWWLIISTACIGLLPDGQFKERINLISSLASFNFLSRCISAVITYHGCEYRPAKASICVANHTSPIDVLVLMCDNCYSLIGQRHSGFLGLLQRALARASPHIWFERSESKDRQAVLKRLKEHVSVPDNPPILIFPEGTCINNTSVMQFKKGGFEVGSVIYPVAIKYDPRFGDAFWNSSRYGMLHYLLNMMSSWAIVCDVWYLPPVRREEGEESIDFANRVKSAIARQGGLVDLMWDGQLKRMKPKKEWKELQQEEFSKKLKGE